MIVESRETIRAERMRRGGLLPGRSLLLVAAATLLYTLAQPPFEIDWLAFLAAAPLAVLVLDPARRSRAVGVGLVAIVFGEATTLAVGGHWLFHAAHGFFGKSAGFSAAFTLAITLTHAGLFLGAAVAFSAPFAHLRPWGVRAAAFASMWVAWELARSRVLYGCPWDLVGHALYRRTTLMQAASLGGAYIVSWLCVACGTLLGLAWIERRRPRRAAAAVIAALCIPAAMEGFGRGRLAARDDTAERGLEIALVQANVGRHELWDPARRTDHLDRLIELSREPSLQGADLIVWAENAVPFLLDADSDARARIAALARERDAFILTGAPRAAQQADGSVRLYNSVYLFAPRGRGYVTYDKRKLLPFVERTPAWGGLLGRTSTLESWPGNRPVVFDVRGWKVAPLICFESTYPEIVRAAAALEADLLLNVSNDSWFDRGAAPRQHFAMTVVRAPEVGLPIVRVANTGVSAVVDASGAIVSELPPKKAAVRMVRVGVTSRPPPIYARVGDVFAWACVAMAIGCLIAVRWRRET